MAQLTIATTPTHTFQFPSSTGNPTSYYVTYAQNGTVVVEKAMGDTGVTWDSTNKKLTVVLTQSDTKKFVPNVKAVCKVKVKISGVVLDSQFITIDVIDTLHPATM